MITNLEKSLVEDISVLLSVLPQDDLAEVRVVDQSVNVDLVGHVDHLLFLWIQAESLHRIKSVLRESKFEMEWREIYKLYCVSSLAWKNVKNRAAPSSSC